MAAVPTAALAATASDDAQTSKVTVTNAQVDTLELQNSSVDNVTIEGAPHRPDDGREPERQERLRADAR